MEQSEDLTEKFLGKKFKEKGNFLNKKELLLLKKKEIKEKTVNEIIGKWAKFIFFLYTFIFSIKAVVLPENMGPQIT